MNDDERFDHEDPADETVGADESDGLDAVDGLDALDAFDQLDALDELALLEELARLVDQHELLPEDLDRAMRDAADVAGGHDELAELAYDSSTERVPAGVRGQSGPRQLTFRTPVVAVELEVTSSPRALVGQFVPAPVSHAALRTPERLVSLDVDELGRFHVDELPRGPLSIRCQVEGVTADTDWFLV